MDRLLEGVSWTGFAERVARLNALPRGRCLGCRSASATGAVAGARVERGGLCTPAGVAKVKVQHRDKTVYAIARRTDWANGFTT